MLHKHKSLSTALRILIVSGLVISTASCGGSGGDNNSGFNEPEVSHPIYPNDGEQPNEPDDGEQTTEPSEPDDSEKPVEPSEPPIAEETWYKPPVLTTWQWQLSGTVNTSYDVDVYDIDLFDSSDSLIQQLQASGKKVICYFSAGSYENWRPDASQFNESDLGDNLDGWEGERWLDIRTANVKSIMEQRLDLAKQKGCDGVEPDNVDGYTNNTGINLSSSDQLAYNRFLANEAHARGLSIGLKNDLDQVIELVDYFDFAVNEQCSEWNECDMLSPFIEQGKAVFIAEYLQKYVDNETERSNLCANSIDMKFSTLILPLDLNDQYRYSCL